MIKKYNIKSILLILIYFAICSCNEDDLLENEESNEIIVDSTIPLPVIMGSESTECVANIIFLAEGFTDSELAEFKNLCDIAKKAILDLEPFAAVSNNLNFYRVDSPSITSGIKTKQFISTCNGTTGKNTSSSTPWEVFTNRIGLERYAGMESLKRDYLEELYSDYATGDYAYTIIIANTTGWYGGAEFPGVTEYNTILNPKVSNAIVAKYDSGNLFKFLIRHEFGHSFGNMDDEYEDVTSNCMIETYEPWYWTSTPKANVLTYNPNTWFEGARGIPTGFWREWENSIMRTDYYSTTFSPIQSEIVHQRLVDAIGCP